MKDFPIKKILKFNLGEFRDLKQFYLARSSLLPQSNVEGILEESFVIGTRVDSNR